MYALWFRNPLWTLPPSLPTTMNEAVDRFLGALDGDSFVELGRLSEEELARYEDLCSTYCMKKLGLDGRNPELVKNSQCLNAHNAAHIILVRAWAKARERVAKEKTR